MSENTPKILEEGLTFEDVLVVPAFSEILPRETNTETKVSRNIGLKLPIVSAAMDTVTESSLAISIARSGGLGFIHKNMSIEDQATQVRKVKRAESGLITDPITLEESALVGDALKIMKENKIGGIPIIGKDKVLRGILTNRDLRFTKDMNLPVSSIMTKGPLITAKEGTTLKQAEVTLEKHKIEKLPIVNENNILTGLITYKDILRVVSYPNANKDSLGRLRVGAAIGVTADMLERLGALVDVDVDVVTIDTAHGHSKGVLEAVKKAKQAFSGIDIIAGNVATYEGAKALIDAGADGIKVGIGPGSICTTRVVTGIGVPQLTAIINVAKATSGTDVSLIADGGIRYSGDLVKAIIAGADCIMAGGMFAGVEESPGETIILEGRKFKVYRGMGSLEAMQSGSKDRYFQDVEDDIKKLVPEGIVGRVPYKGNISEVITQFIGGLKAGMGYTGSIDIPSLKKAKFIKMTSAGLAESHPHNITITREAPNYSR